MVLGPPPRRDPMGRKRKAAAPQPQIVAAPTIYEATLGAAGGVVRVMPAIGQVQAQGLEKERA